MFESGCVLAALLPSAEHPPLVSNAQTILAILFANATASESGDIEPPIDTGRPDVDGKIDVHRTDCTPTETMDAAMQGPKSFAIGQARLLRHTAHFGNR